jgi:hypothetical protein
MELQKTPRDVKRILATSRDFMEPQKTSRDLKRLQELLRDFKRF